MRAKAQVKGIKELHEALDKLKAAGQGAKLGTAVDAGLLVIQNEIVANAPYKTGNYKRGWHLGEAKVTRSGAYNTTGNNVVYGPRLEFGFEDVDARGRNYHQPAQPHVRPAFDNKRAAALDEVEKALKSLIDGAI